MSGVNGGLAETTMLANKQHGIVAVKGRSARPSWRQNQRSQARSCEGGPSATSYATSAARRRSKKCISRWKSCQNVECEAFTGIATKRSRRCLRVWVGEEGSSIPACEGGATGTTLGRKAAEKPANPPELPRRRETAGCSIVRPKGGNSSRAGGAGGTEKDSVRARRDLIENERGTGARD